MEPLLFLLLLALLLGVKHSFDADHVAAVSAYVTRAGSAKSALRLGLHWAAGHIVTAAAVTVALFAFKDYLLSAYLESFETVVAVMLVAIGLLALRDAAGYHRHAHRHGPIVHKHAHRHGEGSHDHRHMFGIGLVHGLASNDEIIILLTLSIGLTSLLGLLAGIALFSIGVVLGMGVFSLMVSMPSARWGGRVRRVMVGGSGLLSALYGALMLAGAA